MSVSLCITATCLEAALTSKSFPAAACPPRLDHVVPWRSPREALHCTASAIVAIVRRPHGHSVALQSRNSPHLNRSNPGTYSEQTSVLDPGRSLTVS